MLKYLTHGLSAAGVRSLLLGCAMPGLRYLSPAPASTFERTAGQHPGVEYLASARLERHLV